MNYYDNFYEGLNDNRNALYRQINTVSSLNKLLSTVCCEIHNLNNYNINVKGQNTCIIKENLKNTINKLIYHENKLQELIKIKDGFPVFQLTDVENISLIKTLASQDYKDTTVINNIKKEFDIIKKIIEETTINAQKENDFLTINTLTNLLYDINKTLILYTY